jgi:hypothetical protein
MSIRAKALCSPTASGTVVLVAATMDLLGKANWYMPKWLGAIVPKLRAESGAAAVGESAQHTARFRHFGWPTRFQLCPRKIGSSGSSR